MEYQVNIIFIFVFCLSIVEPIPSPEEGGRYGAHQASNWPKNQPRQYNYPRPQNFYPSVNNTSNRNYNQDYRPHERSYDSRHSSVHHGTPERRQFYEGHNGRNNRPHSLPMSTTTNGHNFKVKSLADTAPPPYRPMRQYEYEDRNNGGYSPKVERNYQQPFNRLYNAPRVQYQRPVLENSAYRYRDFTQPQRSGYFDKQNMPQNRPASPMDFRYPAQNRIVDSMPETFKPPPNVAPFPPPAISGTTPQPRREINKILSDPKIRNYLASNHKRYLILHSNGSVEHVDSLDSIVQSYPNYLMVKAGDIVTNTQNSSLKHVPPILREEMLSPKLPEVTQRIPIETRDFPPYGYNNPRVPYVTENAYAQPIDKSVNIPHEDDAISNDGEIVLMSTPASINTLTDFVERTTEYYAPISFVETTPEYGTPNTIIEYTTPIPFVETTTEYSATESVTSSITTTVEDEDQMFTELPIEMISDEPVTDTSYLLTTVDYSILESTANYPSDVHLGNIMPSETYNVPQVERKSDITPKLRGLYPSALEKFIQQHFGPILLGNKLNTVTTDRSTTILETEESVIDPFDVSSIIDAITEMTIANLSTTERAEVLYSVDEFNTSFPFMDDLNYKPSLFETRLLDEQQTAYTETPLASNNNGGVTYPDGFNPFINPSNEQTQNPKHKKKHRHNKGSTQSTGNPYNPMITYDEDETSTLYTTTEYINPLESSFVTESSFENKYTDSTETGIYDTPNSILVNEKENDTNPFFERTATQLLKQRRGVKNKNRIKPVTEDYVEDSTNPFIADTTDSVIYIEEISEYLPDSVDENENILNPFMDTNPFNEDRQNPFITNEDYSLNPFAEYYTDEITSTQTEIPVTEDIPLVYDESENIYETNVVPFAYSTTENSHYDFSTTPIPDYDLNTISDDIDAFPTTTDKMVVLTMTDNKPAAWFKTDADFWERLANGTIPYDVVYFFQVHAQPVVEKDTKTTMYPNGTIVQELIETIWEREGDPAPILVKSTKTVYPEKQP